LAVERAEPFEDITANEHAMALDRVSLRGAPVGLEIENRLLAKPPMFVVFVDASYARHQVYSKSLTDPLEKDRTHYAAPLACAHTLEPFEPTGSYLSVVVDEADVLGVTEWKKQVPSLNWGQDALGAEESEVKPPRRPLEVATHPRR
jgi:hypothetical protein